MPVRPPIDILGEVARLKFIALFVATAVAWFAAPAPAAHASATPANFEVMLVLDTSGSMAGHPIEAAVGAATSFVAHMPPGVRIGAESFGRQIKLLSPPTTNRALLRAQLAGLTAGGNSPLHDAVIAASHAFTPAAKYRAIVLLSDGGDQGSLATLDAAAAAVSGVHVEAVSLTTRKTDLGALQRLGTVTSADDPNALPAVLGRIEALLIPATVKQTPAPTTTTRPPAPTTSMSAPTTVAPTTTTAAAPTTTTVAPTTTVATTQPAASTTDLPSRSGIWIGAGLVFVAVSGVVLLTVLGRD